MKKLLTALALTSLFLSSCNKSSADGYVFGKKEFEHKDLSVTVVTHQSRKEMSSFAQQNGVSAEEAKVTAAFSIINPSTNKCEVHIIDPEVSYQPEYIGHELVHCIYGRWHS